MCVRGSVSCFGGARAFVTSERRLLRLGHREFDGSGRIDPLVPVLMAVGFVIDLVRGGSKSVWLDEAISVSYAREGFGQFLHTVSHRDPNMGLYYLLLRPWIAVFGESESAIRSLSAVFAALAVGAVAVLGRRLFDRWTGLVAGLFLALNAFFVEYAQTARSYTLVVLLVVLSSYFFVAELERPSRAFAVGYVVSSALAVYAHYFAVYVLVAQLLTLAVIERRGALTRRWVAIGVLRGCLVCSRAGFSARSGTGNISWITRAETLRPCEPSGCALLEPGDRADACRSRGLRRRRASSQRAECRGTAAGRSGL